MTARAKNAPKPHLLAVAAMANPLANPAASLATNQALVVMANRVAKALHHAAHVWAMRLSVRNVMHWSQRKMRCAAWPHKPMAKC